MHRTLAATGLSLLFAVARLLTAGDEKTTPKVDRLSGWGKLELTDSQKKELYGIEAEYSAKIEDLEDQLKKLKEQRESKMLKVLTDEQRKKLKELNQPSGSGSSSK